jgi:hypothetical protein
MCQLGKKEVMRLDSSKRSPGRARSVGLGTGTEQEKEQEFQQRLRNSTKDFITRSQLVPGFAVSRLRPGSALPRLKITHIFISRLSIVQSALRTTGTPRPPSIHL